LPGAIDVSCKRNARDNQQRREEEAHDFIEYDFSEDDISF